MLSRTVITYSTPSAPPASTSRFHRRAAYTQCLRCAGAPRRPAGGSGLSLTILSWHAALYDPGELDHRYSRTSMPTWPSPRSEQLGTPNPPRNPFHAGQVFRGFPIHAFATACQVARSPVRSRPTRSAPGSFYFQASNGSVALPVAGYDYNSDWTPLLAGLSPARMAASLAAPDPDLTLSRHPARATARRLPPSVENWSSSCCQLARSQRR